MRRASTDSASGPPYGLCSSVFWMVDFAMRQCLAWTTPLIHPKSSKARTALIAPRMYDRALPLAKSARKYRSSNLDLSTPGLSHEGAMVRIHLGRPLLHMFMACGGGSRGSTAWNRGRGRLV